MNETQSRQDARKVLFEVISKEEIEDLQKKGKSLIETLKMPTPAYCDFDKCFRILRVGILCNKYNYKNNKHRKISF